MEKSLKLLSDIEVKLTVELGRCRMFVSELLKLRQGSLVDLDKHPQDPLDVYVNDQLIARGEVVVINGKYGVRVTELVESGRNRAGKILKAS